MRRTRAVLLGVLIAVVGLCVGGGAVEVARWWATPAATPLDAGREWFPSKNAAGQPSAAADDGGRILASWEVAADRRLVLYGYRPSVSTPADALSVVPLGIQYTAVQPLPWSPRRGWHPSGTAGRGAALPRGDELYAGSMPAGFLGLDAPLATAWGLSARGVTTRITWSDGAVTEAPFADHAFIQARPDPHYRLRPENRQPPTDRLCVVRIEALDGAGNVLAAHELPRNIGPEVRGPSATGGPAIR